MPQVRRGTATVSWRASLGNQIEGILDAAAGNEIRSGKFDSPESSSALAVNTFGYFLHRPEDLPPLPDLEHAGWPARSLSLEKTVRFRWPGGRHPVLDCVLTTGSALIGIECKRFEPFRGNAKAVFSETYWRPVWGNRMTGYQRVRDLLRADPSRYAFLDAAQLVKHALALLTEARERRRGLRPVLVYVYAEPSAWPRSGRPIEARDKTTLHEDEIAQFADLVAGDAVEFAACSYRRLLSAWQHQSVDALRKHANAVMARY